MNAHDWGDSIRLETKFESGAAEGSFSGYGAVFNNTDSHGDVIAPKAFRETLREWKKLKSLPPMLLNHGAGIFGSPQDDLPIGVWTAMEEDDNGLRVDGILNTKSPRGAEVYSLLKMDPRPAIDGLSIGYRVKQAKNGTKPEEPRRTLQMVDLLELSLVTLPANNRARVTNVKSIEEISSFPEAEKILRDAGFSRKDAVAFVSRIKAIGTQSDSVDDGLTVAIAFAEAELANFRHSIRRQNHV